MKQYTENEVRNSFYTEDISEVVSNFTADLDEELTKEAVLKMIGYIMDKTIERSGEDFMKNWTATDKLVWCVREAYRMGCAYALEIALEGNNLTFQKMA